MNGADPYLGILFLVLLAAIICTAMVTLSWVLGPKKNTPYKQSPYECGVAPAGSARERFPIKFYLVAIVFILFDIEVVFLWGWISVFKNAEPAFQMFSFAELLVYMVVWAVTYVYAIRIGAIDWDETTSLEAAKMGTPKTDEPKAIPTPTPTPSPTPVGGQ